MPTYSVADLGGAKGQNRMLAPHLGEILDPPLMLFGKYFAENCMGIKEIGPRGHPFPRYATDNYQFSY